MKLSRNKIRKIRKQQHQSVRRWKKQHRTSGRRVTFRQSRSRRSGSVITKYTPKVDKIVNRTLKKYVGDNELYKLKEKYRKLRREKRMLRKHMNMVGGTDMNDALIRAIATAAAIATQETLKNQQIKPQPPSTEPQPPSTEPQPPSTEQQPPSNNNLDSSKANEANPETTNSPTTSEPNSTTSDNKEAGESSSTGVSTPANTSKKPPFQLGPEIEGDVSIGMEEHECNDQTKVYELVSFLIKKGLPYYIQIQGKSGDKALNKNDTNIFDLRRILYGKFTQDIKKISESKRNLYIEAKETVGIANSELYGSNEPGLFIYTGEKGQILKDSKDTSIQIRLLQDDPNAPPIPPLSDSKRLYKLKGKGGDVKPASIDTTTLLTNLDKGNEIDMSEFRLQIAPMTPSELNKEAQKVAAGKNNDPEAKVVVDESNTYIVNLSLGCKIVSIQTLKKSLEKARNSLENDKDASKQSALDVILMLTSLLQNPEFAKSDGYDDFKDKVFGFSYKIGGSERLYGFNQMQTFFDDKKGNIPPRVTKEFFKLLNLLGHGPGGSNGDCLRFDSASPSTYILKKLQTFEEDGKIVTKTIETLDSASNMNGFAKQLSKIGEVGGDNEEGSAPETPDNKNANQATPAAAPEATPAATQAVTQAATPAATTEPANTSEVPESTTPAATSVNTNIEPLKKEQIKEIDAINTLGIPWKAYLIRKFIFNDKDKDLENMNLVHLMGFGTASDEYIPESEESKRIFERGANKNITPSIGQNSNMDDTIDKVVTLYQSEDMAKLEEKAREKAKEYKNKL